MIATLRGKILGSGEHSIIVDVSGVGYSVMTIPAVRLGSEIGREIFLHTALVVREDAFTLYGYQSTEERDLFQLLQTVSGIGPKVSHAVLSSLSVAEIVKAISTGQARTLEQVSGLGKKGAQRIILELKEKVASLAIQSTREDGAADASGLSLAQALAGLGFSPREIDHALEIVEHSSADSIEERLKVALAALHSGGPRV